MELSLLVGKEKPRQLVLLPCKRPDNGPAYAIGFTNVTSNGERACKVDLIPMLDVETELYEKTLPHVWGCLGLLSVCDEDFVGVITAISHVGTIHGQKLFRIDRVQFLSLSTSLFDGLGYDALGSQSGSEHEYSQPRTFTRSAPQDHPIFEVASLLSDGTFYFAYDWDCTKSLQKMLKFQRPFSWKSCERSFFWNEFMMKPISRFNKKLPTEMQEYIQTAGIFVVSFQGFAEVKEFSFGASTCAFAVFSRVSCKRAGTRYRSRGIDDDGNVSNFVETETLFAHQEYTFSHIIVRGTVPVFWDQQGFQLGFPRIQLTRTPAATQPAFERHINNLHESYGLIHIVNLLSQKEGQAELVLSNALDFHIRKYPSVSVLSETTFDIYSICRNGCFERLDTLFHMIGRDLQIFGYFAIDSSNNQLKEQKGIFRVNCLDCLDRTNMVQSYIVKRTVDLFVRNYLLRSNVTYDAGVFHEALSSVWANNGDQLSRIYARSDAIKSSYGRLGKFTLSSFVEDFKNTARRFYSNNFAEKSRQQAIDTFLGKVAGQKVVSIYSPSPDLVEAEMISRRREYSELEPILVQLLTWNTNGCIPQGDYDYSLLISPFKGKLTSTFGSFNYLVGVPTPHIVAVGFQEIVNLNATQIMSVDPERRIMWENIILKYLKDSHPKHSFSLLVSHQLVGVSVSLFIRADYIDSVREVKIASKKTGMGGIAGNKGSVAIRLNVHNTSMCFVVSHFAAGQSNPQERDRDMVFALKELQMSGGQDILAHDVVFWFGDFNYRVELDRQEALSLIRDNKYEELRAHDQLRQRMKQGLVFEGFVEPIINFAPTYKYDVGTNVYDTSDKLRTPSWTDRILYRGSDVTELFYDRAELDASDHKPVKAVFHVQTMKIDRQKELQVRDKVLNELQISKCDTEASEGEGALVKADSSFDLIELDENLSEAVPPLPPRPRTSTK